MAENSPTKLFITKNETTYTQYKVYLVGDIEEQADYMDLITMLRDPDSPKSILLYLNSNGGSTDAGMPIIHAIQESPHAVVAVVDGMVASMAADIALACPKIHMNPHSRLMIHNYSSGTVGKGHEMASSIDSDEKYFKEFMKSLYKKFLTKGEIDEILKGGDLYLHRDSGLASWSSKPLIGAVERLKKAGKLFDTNEASEVRL